MDGLSQNKAQEFVGVHQSTLSRWISSGILQGVPGGGEKWKTSKLQPYHLMQALTIKELRDSGASMQQIRKALDRLREGDHAEDWHERNWLFLDANGDIAAYDEDKDLLRRVQDSQGYVVDVSGIRERIKHLQRQTAQQDMFSEEQVDHERERVEA